MATNHAVSHKENEAKPWQQRRMLPCATDRSQQCDFFSRVVRHRLPTKNMLRLHLARSFLPNYRANSYSYSGNSLQNPLLAPNKRAQSELDEELDEDELDFAEACPSRGACVSQVVWMCSERLPCRDERSQSWQNARPCNESCIISTSEACASPRACASQFIWMFSEKFPM